MEEGRKKASDESAEEFSTVVVKYAKEKEDLRLLRKKVEKFQGSITAQELKYPALKTIGCLIESGGESLAALRGREKVGRNKEGGGTALSEEEKRKKEEVWKLWSRVNTMRMKVKAGKIVGMELAMEILLGEKRIGLSLVSDEERATLSTSEILEEMVPVPRMVVTPKVVLGKRVAELTPKSSPRKVSNQSFRDIGCSISKI